MNKSGIRPQKPKIKKKTKTKETKKFLILENIRSVYNVGAIFRTADAIGIDKIYLVGYTPSPIDRFGRARQDLHKAALGAEKNITWEHLKNENAGDLINKLKMNKINSEKFITIAIEQTKSSIDYKKIPIKIKGQNVAIVVGNEISGVSESVLSIVDLVAEIPMKGKKESLNVSVATGVALFEIFN